MVVFLVITYVAGLWIGFALGSKRVHDHGSEFLPWGIGWGVLTIGLAFLRVAPASDFAAFVGFLALVGFVAWLYVFGFKAGDPDGNAYGDPNPASGAVKFSV